MLGMHGTLEANLAMHHADLIVCVGARFDDRVTSRLDKFSPGDVTVSADWQGGFFCPCHGSKFDISGRVFKNVPAPTNLPVPPYQFVTDNRILIGAEKGNA